MKKFKQFVNEDSKYSTDDWTIIDYDNDSGKILSVKRTSDGEVFSIGDEIGLRPDNKSAGKIDRLWKSFEQMRIDIGNLGLVLNDDLVNLKKTNEEYHSKFDLDFFIEKYHEWNNQGGEPGYKKPSYESVLEFLQNNYEDFSTDKDLIVAILGKLKEEKVTESVNEDYDGLNPELLRQMIQLSNNSRLTHEAAVLLTGKLEDNEMQRLLQWFYHANRS